MKSRLSVFKEHDDAVLQDAIDAAELHVDRDAVGSLSDEAVLWLAADFLSSVPQGKHARLVSRENEGKTLYLKQYERVIRKAVGGPRVI